MKNTILVCEDIFGLEMYSIIEQINVWKTRRGINDGFNIIGYISDDENPFDSTSLSLKRIGSICNWKLLQDESYILGISDPGRKKQIVNQLKSVGCKFETVLAPWMLTMSISVDEGSVVAAYSMKTGIRVGKYTTIIGSMLTSRSVGDYSTIMRFSNITGNVGNNAYVGNHVYTHLGKTIGDGCFVEDGSIVVKDVKSCTRVFGIPAKKIR